MPADDYDTAGDLDALRMENELLALENTFLKGRMRALEQSLDDARATEDKLRKRLGALTKTASEPPPSA